MNDDIKKIVELNKIKSLSTLDDALFLIENNKFHIAVNRIYYSAYYMITCFALKDGFETSKHSQLLGWFNKNYVSKGIVDVESGKKVMRLFELRNKADYDIYAVFSKNETIELYNDCKIFTDKLADILNKSPN